MAKQANALRLPVWTARVGKDKPGMSPLGLEAVGEAMVANYLLPGLTNATVYARYFSFLSWIVGTFAESHPSALNGRARANAFTRWRTSLEHAWRLCSSHVAPDLTGVIGITEARKTPLGKTRTVQLAIRAASAFEPQNYGASFRGLRFARWGEHGTLELSPLGNELFRAFDESLRAGCTREQQLSLNTLLSGAAEIESRRLENLADRFHVRPVTPGEPEFGPLTQALLHNRASRANEWGVGFPDLARSRGLLLLLELYDQGAGSYTEANEFHRTFATRRHPDGKAVGRLSRSMEETFSSWRRYLERQYQKRALAGFWHELLAYLISNEPQSVPGERIVARLCELIGSSQELKGALARHGLSTTLNAFEAALVATAPKSESARSRQLWDTAITIADLSENGPVGQERLGKAIQLLVLLLFQWREDSKGISAFHHNMHLHGGVARLALPWMAQEFQRRGGDSLLETVRWLVEWCVIAQANRVAFEKLPQGDRFFIKRDDSGYRRADSVRDRASYFNFDSDRLAGATSLLTEIGLLKNDDTITITSAGRRIKAQLDDLVPLSEVNAMPTALEDLGDAAV